MAKISTLRDDFEDGVIDASLWTTTGTVSETGGNLVLSASGAGVYSTANSTSRYDLSQSSITIQAPTVTPTGSGGDLQSILELELDANNRIAIIKYGADLLFLYDDGGVQNVVGLTTYNAVNHLYWRIRADSSNVYWETSVTGAGVFFIQATQNIASMFPITSLQVKLYTVYFTFEPAPGSFRVASVNPGLQLTFSGASTSSGSLVLLQLHTLTFSGASTSSGSLDWTIPPLTAYSMTFDGASTSSGSLSFYVLMPGSLAFAGLSTSSGSLALTLLDALSFIGESFATGSITFSVFTPVADPALIQYFTFEPPVVYDRPGVHSKTPRRVRQYAYYDRHSLGATGVSVLKIDGSYQSIYTPTVDQIASAEKVYQGGHIYTIPQSDADELSAAGYSVTPLPVPVPLVTVFPLEDLYPSEDLFPGYHDTVLVS